MIKMGIYILILMACTPFVKSLLLLDTLFPTQITILLSSLPKPYDTFLSAITATMSFLEKELEPNALINSVIDEYDC